MATLDEADESLTKTSIYAPMSGTISSLRVELGERVVGTSMMSGTEMLRIADLDQNGSGGRGKRERHCKGIPR